MRKNLSGRWLVTLTLVMVSLVLTPRSARAQASYSFLYHPDLKWRLGSSLDIADPFDYIESCVVAEERPGKTGGAAFTMDVVKNSEDLRKFMKIDARLEAQFGPGSSANASFSLEHERHFRSDQVTVVLLAEERFAFSEVVGTSIPEHLAKLPASEFRRRCGTHYIAQLTSGSKVAVLFTASNLTNDEKRTLTLGVGGEYAGTKAQVSFFEGFSEHKKKGSGKIEIISTGGHGISGFAGFAESLLAQGGPAEIAEKIGKNLRDLLNTFGKENAAPIAYVAAPLERLRPGLSVVVVEELRFQQLDLMNERAREAGRRRTVLEAALDGEKPWSELIPEVSTGEAGRESVRRASRLLLAYQLQLGKIHRVCIEADDLEKCATPELPDAGVRIPEFPQEPVAGFQFSVGKVANASVCSQEGLVPEDESAAYLDGAAEEVVRKYARLNPSHVAELVLNVRGAKLAPVGRIVRWTPKRGADAAKEVTPVAIFRLAPCGGAFPALSEASVPGPQLKAMLDAPRGDDRAVFKLAVTDTIGRRFVADIAEIQGGVIVAKSGVVACQPGDDGWTCSTRRRRAAAP